MGAGQAQASAQPPPVFRGLTFLHGCVPTEISQSGSAGTPPRVHDLGTASGYSAVPTRHPAARSTSSGPGLSLPRRSARDQATRTTALAALWDSRPSSLPCISTALTVRVPVGGEELVEHLDVARGEVAVDFLFGHPEAERAGGLRVPADRLVLEGALVLVGLRPQPGAELAYPQLPRGDLCGGLPRCRRRSFLMPRKVPPRARAGAWSRRAMGSSEQAWTCSSGCSKADESWSNFIQRGGALQRYRAAR
jgi:hypothetical protein